MEKKEHGTIENDSYISPFGSEIIKFGSEISLTFLGSPNDFPKPWILVSGKMRFSTVCYDYIVGAIIEASNGKRIMLDDLRTYSPHNIDS